VDALPGPPDNAPGPFKERYYGAMDALRRGQCDDCHMRRDESPHQPIDGLPTFHLSIRHASTCPLKASNLELFARELGYEWHGESHTLKVGIDKDGRILGTES
jgi:hypothetical protein